MKTIIYADVLFIINFIINIILIKITSIFSKTKPSVLRMSASSAIGALYALFMFFPSINFLYIFPMKIAVSFIMIKITNPGSVVWKLIKLCAVFYLVSFTFAGILLSLIYFTNFAGNAAPIYSNGIFYFNISLKNLIFTSAIAYGLIKMSSAIFSRNKMLGIQNLKIYIGNKECSINALSDTGNLLTDPLSKKPVVIAEKRYIESLFPCGVPEIENADDFRSIIRIIPYSCVGNNSGIMTGFVPDKILINGKETTDAIVGISESPLSEHDEYNALFNPNILINRRS